MRAHYSLGIDSSRAFEPKPSRHFHAAHVDLTAWSVTRQMLGLTRRAGRHSQLIAAPWRRGCNGFVAWIGEYELSGGRRCE
jgi:hypothetical protein